MWISLLTKEHFSSFSSSFFSVSRDARDLFDSPHIYATFVEGVTTRLLPAILQQAIDHKASYIPSIEEWLDIRYRNFAFDCFMPFLEMEDPLPDQVIMSPILQSFVKKAGLMSALANVSSTFFNSFTTLLFTYAFDFLFFFFFRDQGSIFI